MRLLTTCWLHQQTSPCLALGFRLISLLHFRDCLASFQARPIRTFAGNRPAPNAKHVAMVTPESVDLECTLAFHLTCMTKTQFRLGVAAIFTAIPLHNLTSLSRYTVAKDQPLCTLAGGVFYSEICLWKFHKLKVLGDQQNHVIKTASG